MTVFMNLVMRGERRSAASVNFGSGMLSTLGNFTLTRHGYIPYFGRLAPYLERPWRRLLTPEVSRRAADDVIANAREVLDAASADQHHRVLLQVVPFTRDVGGDLHPVGEAARGRPCGAPSSASSAWWCRRARTRPRFCGLALRAGAAVFAASALHDPG